MNVQKTLLVVSGDSSIAVVQVSCITATVAFLQLPTVPGRLNYCVRSNNTVKGHDMSDQENLNLMLPLSLQFSYRV